MTRNVVHNPESLRYELQVDGVQVGFIDYEVTDGAIDLLHTEVDKESREDGLGASLVEGSLDLIRTDSSSRVIPSCPFVKKWIGENPDYQDLLGR